VHVALLPVTPQQGAQRACILHQHSDDRVVARDHGRVGVDILPRWVVVQSQYHGVQGRCIGAQVIPSQDG